MAAPNLPALLDFEGQLERAAQTILETAGINAFISQFNGKLPTINTGIYCDIGPAIDQLTLLPLGAQTQLGAEDFFRYPASLTFEIEVKRDADLPPNQSGVYSFLAQARGLIRAAMMMTVFPFTDTNLPYLRVSEIRPMGTTTGQNTARNTDVCTLRFQVTFAIQPGAWPSAFPPATTTSPTT